MKFLWLVCGWLSLGFSTPALSQGVEWQQRSQAIATWMWLDIYQASLFTQSGFQVDKLLDDSQPLKLQLCYLKPIGKKDLIKGAQAVLSKSELSESLTTDLKQAVEALHHNYVDVSPGDCYILEYSPEEGTELKLNNQLAFQTQAKGFKAVYFGIWLGENPLSESLKDELLTPLSEPVS